jgi:pimeloyl-ACP methyl ester carboxylesterase
LAKVMAIAWLLVWVAAAAQAGAPAPWLTFQDPPPLPPPAAEGRVEHDGARIWYATFGAGPPVLLLHAGGGDAGDFGFQVPALIADGRRVIVIDSRSQGHSSWDGRPLTYQRMEGDVLAVMDALAIPKADIVGWSDGAILGLVMAMNDPDRLGRLFAFGLNTDLAGLNDGWKDAPILDRLYRWERARYLAIAPAPERFEDMADAVDRLTSTQPNFTAAQLAAIKGPAIAVVDGEHEEFIRPAHTRRIAALIPGARLIILPGVSHFAPIQDPAGFNAAMIAFLDGR